MWESSAVWRWRKIKCQFIQQQQQQQIDNKSQLVNVVFAIKITIHNLGLSIIIKMSRSCNYSNWFINKFWNINKNIFAN